MSKFHAGHRINSVYLYLKGKHEEKGEKLLKSQFAEDILQITKVHFHRLLHLERLSDNQIRSMAVLEQYGINPDFFKEQDAPMLLVDVPGINDNITLGEIKRTIEQSTNPDFQKEALELLQKLAKSNLEIIELLKQQQKK